MKRKASDRPLFLTQTILSNALLSTEQTLSNPDFPGRKATPKNLGLRRASFLSRTGFVSYWGAMLAFQKIWRNLGLRHCPDD